MASGQLEAEDSDSSAAARKGAEEEKEVLEVFEKASTSNLPGAPARLYLDLGEE